MKKLLTYLSVCLALIGTLRAQSLADLARQERERKKGLGSSVVITNDSIRPAAVTGTPALPGPAGPEEEAKPVVKESSAPPDRQGRDEKSWRAAFAKTRGDLKTAEDETKVLELQMNQSRRDYLQRSDLFNREMVLAAEINTLQRSLDQKKVEIERLKQLLLTMEDDLRRSGGPAGWAR